MNTFYMVNGLEIEELKTVKGKAYMEDFKRRPMYNNLKDIPVPEGYILEGMSFIKTAETIEKEERQGKLNRLAEIDREALRPLRAILADTGTDFDRERVKALEAEAVKIRGEL